MITVIDAQPIKLAISINVRRLREERSWSQGDLAERIGISRVGLCKIENGRMSPSSEVLFAIADVFGVSADSLRQAPAEKISAA